MLLQCTADIGGIPKSCLDETLDKAIFLYVPPLHHSMGQTIKSLASFCMSICLSAPLYGRNFCLILMKFCTEVRDPKSKNAFVTDQNPITCSPILPQLATSVMHFQREGPNTTVTRLTDRSWGLRAQTTCLGSRERLQAESYRML